LTTQLVGHDSNQAKISESHHLRCAPPAHYEEEELIVSPTDFDCATEVIAPLNLKASVAQCGAFRSLFLRWLISRFDVITLCRLTSSSFIPFTFALLLASQHSYLVECQTDPRSADSAALQAVLVWSTRLGSD
jgi:hypothetical protein